MMNDMGEATRSIGLDDRRPTGRRRWELGALIAQLFMIPFYVAVVTGDLSIGTKIWALLLLAAFTIGYIVLPGRCFDSPLPVKVAVTGALMALTIPLFAVVGSAAATMWIFVAVVGGMFYAAPVALGLGVLLAAAMLLVDLSYGDPLGWELALTMIALTAFMAGFVGNIRLNIELRRTRDELAVAAVAAERERIGRDLHDILGHSLTAITVKAGLARRLVGRDDVAAATEIGDVERLAREALADVRATTSGFREVSLATALAVAGNVLQAAGIAARLPATVDDVDPSARVLFGYVVREAVTNVVRHAHARTCTITVGARSVEIVDDGAGGAAAPGNGLSGLAERVRAAGGTLTAGPRPGGGFAVLATVPATTPDRPVAALHRERR
jgi:two-component system sensor histidine kinase DesK